MMYHAAKTSLFAGIASVAATRVLAVFGAAPNFLAAATDPAGGIETYLPQLGIFGVVVIVFKFMLNRQDVRDADSDKQQQVLIDLLKESLSAEKKAHDITRSKLIEVLEIARDLPTTKKIIESAGDRLSRIQKEIDNATGYKK